MGAWHEGVYGNDIAQDMLITLSKLLECKTSIQEIVEGLKQDGWASKSEAMLMIADVESSFIGKTAFVEDVLVLIDHLKRQAVGYWVEPELRIRALELFEQRLTEVKNPLPLSALEDWMLHRRQQDIFVTFGKEQVYDH